MEQATREEPFSVVVSLRWVGDPVDKHPEAVPVPQTKPQAW